MKQYILSIIALILIIIHLFVPGVEIDGITLTLLVLGFLPFIFPYLKSLELPGGVKIELKDAKEATTKIIENLNDSVTVSDSIKEVVETPGIDEETKEEIDQLEYLKDIAQLDPNLALVGFRIEIEKQIRSITGQHNIRPNMPLVRTIRELHKKGIIGTGPSSGLIELVLLGNKAAHGAEVSPDAINWVLDNAPLILSYFKK